jgi:hypothetical protein
MKMALIVLGAAVGGPMRFVIDQKIRTYTAQTVWNLYSKHCWIISAWTYLWQS